MPRYSRAHKQRTRQRIVEAAARAFRAHGVDGVSIPRLMGEAGLTHGGFYAYFDSKEALFAEACAQTLAERGARLAARAARAPAADRLRVVVDAYLDPAHRDRPATGCVLPALAAEVARQAPEVRRAFTAALEDYLAQLAALVPKRPGAVPEDDALVLAAGLAGALLLARAVDDPALSDRLLQASRAFYASAFPPSADRPPLHSSPTPTPARARGRKDRTA